MTRVLPVWFRFLEKDPFSFFSSIRFFVDILAKPGASGTLSGIYEIKILTFCWEIERRLNWMLESKAFCLDFVSVT